MIQTLTQYSTSNGKLFSTLAEAELEESYQELLKEAEQWLLAEKLKLDEIAERKFYGGR